MKISFVRALWGTCSGTRIFLELKDQSFKRACFHHILILLLSALLVTCGILPGIQQTARRTAEGIHDACWGFVFSSDGLTPEREATAEHHPAFVLPGKIKVEYFPAVPEKLIPADKKGIFWFPRQLLYYEQIPGKRCTVRWRDPLLQKLREKDIPEADLSELAKKLPSLDWRPQGATPEELGTRLLLQVCSLIEPGSTAALPMQLETVSVPDPAAATTESEVLYPGVVMRSFRLLSPWVMVIALWGMSIFQTALYLAMFTLVFRLMGRGREAQFTVRNLLVLEIYAGFPAIVIASFGSALQLPWVGEFQLIYVLGMTLYLLTVIRKLTPLRPPEPRHPGTGEK